MCFPGLWGVFPGGAADGPFTPKAWGGGGARAPPPPRPGRRRSRTRRGQRREDREGGGHPIRRACPHGPELTAMLIVAEVLPAGAFALMPRLKKPVAVVPVQPVAVAV